MTHQQLVEEIVMEVLRRMELLHKKEKQQLLVIHKGLEQNKEQIEELKKNWHVIEMPPNCCEIPTTIRRAVFLEVNQDLLVKGALGVIDTPESQLFSQLMLQGIHVVFVPNDSLSWILNPEGNTKGNKNYIKQLLHYKTQLQGFGVHFYPLKSIIPEEEMGVTSTRFHEKLLTKEIIEKWKEDCIYVNPHTIITPLALDIAKEKGIKICIEEPKRGS
jgi:hypothetical protein